MKTCKKEYLVQWVAVCLAIVLGVGLYSGLPVSATQSRKQNFSTDYTLTGDGAQDILNVALAQQGKTGSELGYTEEWCADFVSDCADLAGQSEAVPRYGGVDGLKKKILTAGGVVVTSPQPGDIVFFSGHVEIVYSGSGSSLKSIGGNTSSAGSLYSRKVSSPRVHGGSYTVVRPNYKRATLNPPTISEISIDKNSYAIGENIVFHVQSDTASSYTIGIHKDGIPYETIWNFTENTYTYKLTEAGSYYAYLSASNSAGYKDSSGIWFTVYDSKPTTSILSISQSSYAIGEPVEFNFTSDNADNFTLGIHKDGVPFDIVYDIKQSNYSYTFTQSGNYYAYLCSSNPLGYLDSNGVWFTIYDSAPSVSILSTNKNIYVTGENVIFHTESDTATAYSIGLYKDGIRYTSFWDFTENEYIYTCTEPGEYSAYVTSYNSLGYKDSTYINFTVYAHLPGDLNADNTISPDDIVLLQQYLSGKLTLTQDQWQAADINEDGVVNAFDLVLLRQKLLA